MEEDILIKELRESVDGMIESMEIVVSDRLAIVQELTYQLKDELESLNEE